MSISFRLFGVPVEIQIGFWLTAVLLILPGPAFLPKTSILVWVLVALVSVLIHEFGHALMFKRFKVDPEIALHWMGGHTSGRVLLPLSRKEHILVSLAGPFAGFLIGLPLYFAFEYAPAELVGALPPLARWGVQAFIWANLFWGVLNLIPVMPWDGGHVLEHALGPRRARLAAGISFAIGVLAALYFALVLHTLWGAFIFGLGALHSFQRFAAARGGGATSRPKGPEPKAGPEPLPGEVTALLVRARRALAEDRPGEAIELATRLLEGAAPADVTDKPGEPEAVPPRARAEALSVIAWAKLAEGEPDAARRRFDEAARLGPVDSALEGAIHLARGELGPARSVLEKARASGDDRKEVVGPLIQALLAQGEVERAATTAHEIVDSLSTEDARKMAEIARDGSAFSWSARLFEAAFERERRPEDAYEAARSLSLGGEAVGALAMLRRAVDAGFSDAARAWSDAALEGLRESQALEGVLPRP